ncbi:hypothetical protein [Synergistes jonesii]|uniref:Uncharacterized protein n=1 Tax=Synergistes jonesii TaxID=2754 RepID=A0A073ILC2_9BACT|nr:hypothetical protein [Synergistes jonesii]KEJ91113.1 hypothetical protein EH55_13110 [Synergistes jonesii]OFB60228.1 hypothetical protein JS73_12920 [Synergistes jonesii]OFB60953.1 hypothetical protein JS79_12555 [Synergistes jonesii]OFB64597.1 hypothetical protein JS72_03860 [Synergistes jonesii]OFB66435.1 hypothetical protein JS78_12940 [Synergistes jonesii]
MPEFDVPGLGRARMALTELARNPRASYGQKQLKTQLIESLYTEIRAARMAGHTWKKIMESIRKSGVVIRFSLVFLQKSFAEIDKRYEKETGVKALPPATCRREKKSPSA